MNRNKGFLLVLSLFGMQLSWVFAWASFVMAAAFQRRFPLSSAVCPFGLAFFLTVVTMGRGWRWILVIAVQFLGLGLVCLQTLYLFEDPSPAFFDGVRLTELFSRPREVLQWVALCTALFWTIVFWVFGIMLARRPDTYASISNRFDLGSGALLLLFLSELMILIKGGSAPAGTPTAGLVFSFFIFSIMAFSLARNRGDGHKGFISGYRGIGTLASLTAATLFLGMAMVSFLLPYLTLTAEVGYEVLKTFSQPLGTVILKVLRFLLTNRDFQSEKDSQAGSRLGETSAVPVEEGGWAADLVAVLGWIALGIGILLAILIISCLLWKLLKLLLTRTSHRQRQTDAWQRLIGWILKFRLLLVAGLERIRSWFRGPRTAIHIYLALINWGRRSGIAPLPCDTPLEYGLRLGRRFPRLDNEFQRIIFSHNAAVYGRNSGAPRELAAAKAALGKLGSPRLWPARLRCRLFSTDA